MTHHLKNAFKDWTDILHFLYGFVASALILTYPLLSLLLMAAFILFQVMEEEHPIESYCDLMEFGTGFIFALPIALNGLF
uniref:Uncharacterized protein n=1 Tax=viral metagenome TaxID=1070528 RepID=A0A6M3J9Q9_9ZZZZ